MFALTIPVDSTASVVPTSSKTVFEDIRFYADHFRADVCVYWKMSRMRSNLFSSQSQSTSNIVLYDQEQVFGNEE